MRLLYSTIVLIAQALVHMVALVHYKSRLWVQGRRNWRSRLQIWRKEHPGELVWVHCASLGEFEQGRPVIERIRKDKPQHIILLTFFSPSGYEIRKSYPVVDGVFYLPADTSSASIDFLDIVRPNLACFVKYEYWPNYFFGLQRRGIQLIMISAILRRNQRFFGGMAFFWLPVLRSVSHFYVQDATSAELLSEYGFTNTTIAGDTRFDRVHEMASAAPEYPEILRWSANHSVLIGGSTWPADERVLLGWWNLAPEGWKLLLVPHEVLESHVEAIQRSWPEAELWSKRHSPGWGGGRVVIVDQIGSLSALYQYASLAWIGGGFGAGIHNTLEAAAWALPIAFGPIHEKFAEAVGLIHAGAAYSVSSEAGGVDLLLRWTAPDADNRAKGQASAQFVISGRGATEHIISCLNRF